MKAVEELKTSATAVLQTAFRKHYLKKGPIRGKNLIALEVMKQYLDHFLESERKAAMRCEIKILGVEEKCTGDFARRVGNEMLYQMMAMENVDTLNGYQVRKIITACPHCLNTLKHEYPQLGGHYEVIHHAEFIDRLVKEGKIKLNGSLEGALTYHDPCYLGRYNDVFDPPRSVLRAVSKDGFQELERHGMESFCCGAGGGRM